jgi:2-amino-4-hydroxy-6-hydroxymethyldihydropteridine diphosphokinase
MTSAFIGLGSNLQSPLQQVRQAVDELAALPATSLVACSALYRSAPMGPPDQPHYVNAVAEIDTGLAVLTLLDELQGIERRHGRIRTERWGPRTLDLDILLYGDAGFSTPRIQIPHPGIGQRSFVLYPLAEIAPQLSIPGLGTLQSLLQQCSQDGLERLDDGVSRAV